MGTGDAGRVFKAQSLEWDTPPGVCECAWHGDTFPRSSFGYSHDNVVQAARPGAPAPERSVPLPSLYAATAPASAAGSRRRGRGGIRGRCGAVDAVHTL